MVIIWLRGGWWMPLYLFPQIVLKWVQHERPMVYSPLSRHQIQLPSTGARFCEVLYFAGLPMLGQTILLDFLFMLVNQFCNLQTFKVLTFFFLLFNYFLSHNHYLPPHFPKAWRPGHFPRCPPLSASTVVSEKLGWSGKY